MLSICLVVYKILYVTSGEENFRIGEHRACFVDSLFVQSIAVLSIIHLVLKYMYT